MQKVYNGYVFNPENKQVYLYSSSDGNNIQYEHPVMDAQGWVDGVAHNERISGKAASIITPGDPLKLSEVFYDTTVPGTDVTFQDVMKGILQESHNAQTSNNVGRAGAVITSKDLASMQNLIILGETSAVQTRQGILTGLFEEVATPNLGGKWATFDDGIKFYTNVAEGTSVEPSGGAASVIQINVPKHEGAVAITYRAQAMINGDNPFSRFTARLSQEAAKKENGLVAAEIESNTANSEAGVDFGARTGSPPVSTTNPVTIWNTMISAFSALNRGDWNTIISKAFIFNEYITNDIIRGSLNPIPGQTNVNETQSDVPALPGILWARDNAISSSTAIWALDRDNAIKIFRGPTTAYTVQNNDTETTKDVLRRYMLVETVDSGLIYVITGSAA